MKPDLALFNPEVRKEAILLQVTFVECVLRPVSGHDGWHGLGWPSIPILSKGCLGEPFARSLTWMKPEIVVHLQIWLSKAQSGFILYRQNRACSKAFPLGFGIGPGM